MSDSGSTAAIVAIVVLLVIFVLYGLYLSIKVVREKVGIRRSTASIRRAWHSTLLQEAMVIERLGKWRSTLQAGLHFIVPFLGVFSAPLCCPTAAKHRCEFLQIGHAPTASATTSVIPVATCNSSKRRTKPQCRFKMKVRSFDVRL